MDGSEPDVTDWTITVSGSERREGEKGFTYCITSVDRVEAERRVKLHHGRVHGDEDLQIVDDESFEGVPPADAWYGWNDLRDDQHAASRDRIDALRRQVHDWYHHRVRQVSFPHEPSRGIELRRSWKQAIRIMHRLAGTAKESKHGSDHRDELAESLTAPRESRMLRHLVTRWAEDRARADKISDRDDRRARLRDSGEAAIVLLTVLARTTKPATDADPAPNRRLGRTSTGHSAPTSDQSHLAGP